MQLRPARTTFRTHRLPQSTALGAIYAGEDNTTQGSTVNASTLPNMPTTNFVAATAASEAFDEPLTQAQVIAIVQGLLQADAHPDAIVATGDWRTVAVGDSFTAWPTTRRRA